MTHSRHTDIAGHRLQSPGLFFSKQFCKLSMKFVAIDLSFLYNKCKVPLSNTVKVSMYILAR